MPKRFPGTLLRIKKVDFRTMRTTSYEIALGHIVPETKAKATSRPIMVVTVFGTIWQYPCLTSGAQVIPVVRPHMTRAL